MNLNHKEFFNSIVSKGNYALATGGGNLIAGTRNSGKGLMYNVSPGQLVAYYVENSVATIIDHTNLTADILKKGIHVGVGVDLDSDGLVDDIAQIGQDRINGCNITEFRTIPPSCGTPNIKDILFKDAKCGETYSALVKVDDNLSRSFAPWHKTALEFVGSTVYDCNDTCDTCAEGTADAGEVACKLVDRFNNDVDLKLNGKGYPDYKPGRRLHRPYRAVKLHANSWVYCFTPTDSTCENCNHVDAVKYVRINNEQVELKGTTNPADDTQTLTAQLWHVAEQIETEIEKAFGKHAGSAYVTTGYGNCCTVELHINTCDETFDLLDGDGGADIAACSTLTPLADTFEIDSDCVDCDHEAATVSYDAGVRIIARQITPDCECFLEKPQNTYSRFIDVDTIGDGWACTPNRVVTVQDASVPSNFGGWVQWMEFQNDPRGKGRGYSRGNNHQGWLGLPDKTARVRNAVRHSRCDTAYCEYFVKGDINTKLLDHERSYMTYFSSIYVPQNDGTTKTSVENFLAKVNELAPGTCLTRTVQSCDGGDVAIV